MQAVENPSALFNNCCQTSQEQKAFFRLREVAKVTETTHLILLCSLLDAIDFFPHSAATYGTVYTHHGIS